ncbi:FMN reductase [Methylobacterium sp. Leaf123]|uniref:flavin reductase n=1 Tax=Methylobacterium sp. Leaf123 TaxID=1736264 RepID=UPI0006FC0DE8|nr:flavin reductase [Methylobacterium sp. Leaf123]KQQ23134.1 FMN reductase [Methylobacterium sp. Leaf123]
MTLPESAVPLDASAYRAAMARLASAVHLITTDGPAGRAGFTASAVCSVSDAPPTLLVCVNRASSAYAAFCGNDSLGVSTLGAEHEAVAGLFGGRTPMEARFAAGTWRNLAGGAPTLADALASFACRIVGRHTVGSHEVLYCAVEAVAVSGEADALLYSEHRYRTLPRLLPISAAAEPARAPRAVGARPAEAAPRALRSA